MSEKEIASIHAHLNYLKMWAIEHIGYECMGGDKYVSLPDLLEEIDRLMK
jgi:hypothetical protein